MAFCKGALPEIKKLISKIPDILDKILIWTSAIKTYEQSNPVLMLLLSTIPGEPAIAAAFDSAVNILTQTDSIAKETDTAKKINDFVTELSTLNPSLANSKIFKLASLLLISLNTQNNLTEKEADTIVQLKVFLNSQPAS